MGVVSLCSWGEETKRMLGNPKFEAKKGALKIRQPLSRKGGEIIGRKGTHGNINGEIPASQPVVIGAREVKH